MAIVKLGRKVCAERRFAYRNYMGKIHRKHRARSFGTSLENSHGVSWVRVYLIGKGVFGSVYYARRRRRTPINQEIDFPLQMAVKSAVMDQSSSLMYEKQVLSNLGTSPYIVQCYGDEITEMGDGVKVYNLLLEFYSGLSLNNQIRSSSGGLPESDIQNYARDILQGLHYIHSHGYVHCDIKPDNILLVPGNGERSGTFEAKIADFGLAKSMHEEEGDCFEMRGTLPYMPPEMVRGQKIEYSVDIWALGCVVLEMLSGQTAWDYSYINDLEYVIGYTTRVPEVPNHVSDDAKDFLGWCFEKNGAHRLSAERLLEHPFVCVDDW